MEQETGRTPHPEQPAEGEVVSNDHNSSGDDGTANDDGAQGDDDSDLGGDERTASQLDADNAVEEDTLRTLNPEDPPA